MTKIIFATGNKDKLREIKEILSDCDVDIRSMKEAGINVDIVEDGKTFEDNALIKARAIAAHTDAIVLADDSGLEIDYLNKEPGVYSARYMGEDTSYDIKNNNLIERLDGVPKEKRTARFVCAIAAVLPDGKELVTRQTMEGYIGWEIAGANGFGYDPIFYLDEYGCSSAELTPQQKNAISHRGKADGLWVGDLGLGVEQRRQQGTHRHHHGRDGKQKRGLAYGHFRRYPPAQQPEADDEQRDEQEIRFYVQHAAHRCASQTHQCDRRRTDGIGFTRCTQVLLQRGKAEVFCRIHHCKFQKKTSKQCKIHKRSPFRVRIPAAYHGTGTA